MRIYLWPFIITNCICVSISIDFPLIDGIVMGIILSLLASFGFLINDLKDRNVDKINKSNRLENATSSKLKFTWFVSSLFLIGALILSAIFNFNLFCISIGIATLLVIYTFILRPYLLVSNLLAAFLSLSPLWLPLIISEKNIFNFKFHFFIVLAMYLILVSREIILDVKDYVGDEKCGRKTVPTVFGFQKSIVVSFGLALTASLVLISASFLFFNTLSLIFILTVILFISLSLFPYVKWNTNDKVSMKRYLLYSKIAMAITPFIFLLIKN